MSPTSCTISGRSSASRRRARRSRVFAHGLQLTITDFVAEVHDTHHPIATDLYYEDQKDEAKARAAAFLDHRVPKYLGYFERVLAEQSGRTAHAVGDRLTTVDLSLFQVWVGMTYAFPRAFAGAEARYPPSPRSPRRSRRARTSPRYLASERRIPFNESGVFRRYPELDQAPPKTRRGKP